MRIYRRDYQPSSFLIDHIGLIFELQPQNTVVGAKTQIRRDANVVLHGDELVLRAVELDGAALDPARFEADPQRLVIKDVLLAHRPQAESRSSRY